MYLQRRELDVIAWRGGLARWSTEGGRFLSHVAGSWNAHSFKDFHYEVWRSVLGIGRGCHETKY